MSRELTGLSVWGTAVSWGQRRALCKGELMCDGDRGGPLGGVDGTEPVLHRVKPCVTIYPKPSCLLCWMCYPGSIHQAPPNMFWTADFHPSVSTKSPPSPCLLQEYVNGQLKNKYGDAFIRGNNGEGQAHELTYVRRVQRAIWRIPN